MLKWFVSGHITYNIIILNESLQRPGVSDAATQVCPVVTDAIVQFGPASRTIGIIIIFLDLD